MKNILKTFLFTAVFFSYSSAICKFDINMNNNKIINVKSAYDVYMESGKTIDVSNYAMTFKALAQFSVNWRIPNYLSPRSVGTGNRPTMLKYCFTLKDSDLVNNGTYIRDYVTSWADHKARTSRGDRWNSPSSESIIHVRHQSYDNNGWTTASKFGTLNNEGFNTQTSDRTPFFSDTMHMYSGDASSYSRTTLIYLASYSSQNGKDLASLGLNAVMSTYGYISGGYNYNARCVK